MQQQGFLPAVSMFQPRKWSPTPYGKGPSPLMGRPKRRLGQLFGSQSIFDHPLIGLAVDAGVISISAIALTKKTKGEYVFDGTWRIVTWAILVASGIKAINDLVRLMTMPGPTPVQTQPVVPPAGAPAP